MIPCRMKKWLFTVLLLIVFPVMASHIVGGEFELLHVSGSQYRLNLNYYFDEKNGDQGNKTHSQSRTFGYDFMQRQIGYCIAVMEIN